MIEILKIVLRVICGVLPILWVFSYYMALVKDKFERMCCYVSLLLIAIGILFCILIACGAGWR
jgi:hypothetical protein